MAVSGARPAGSRWCEAAENPIMERARLIRAARAALSRRPPHIERNHDGVSRRQRARCHGALCAVNSLVRREGEEAEHLNSFGSKPWYLRASGDYTRILHDVAAREHHANLAPFLAAAQEMSGQNRQPGSARRLGGNDLRAARRAGGSSIKFKIESFGEFLSRLRRPQAKSQSDAELKIASAGCVAAMKEHVARAIGEAREAVIFLCVEVADGPAITLVLRLVLLLLWRRCDGARRGCAALVRDEVGAHFLGFLWAGIGRTGGGTMIGA